MGGAIISESGGGIIPLRGATSSRNWGAASSGISTGPPRCSSHRACAWPSDGRGRASLLTLFDAGLRLGVVVRIVRLKRGQTVQSTREERRTRSRRRLQPLGLVGFAQVSGGCVDAG